MGWTSQAPGSDQDLVALLDSFSPNTVYWLYLTTKLLGRHSNRKTVFPETNAKENVHLRVSFGDSVSRIKMHRVSHGQGSRYMTWSPTSWRHYSAQRLRQSCVLEGWSQSSRQASGHFVCFMDMWTMRMARNSYNPTQKMCSDTAEECSVDRSQIPLPSLLSSGLKKKKAHF